MTCVANTATATQNGADGVVAQEMQSWAGTTLESRESDVSTAFECM